jgi:predicted AAA+ superfamily ATPase
MYKRLLSLKPAKKSFFLWGQRQTGKSTLLKSQFPDANFINLLLSDEFLAFSSRPSLLRERCALLRPGQLTVIDEVQKVPLLLDEVHNLIESQGLTFGLCGSSARKLKRGQGNLLGGRARRYELLGLSAQELGSQFDLTKLLNRGYLPSHYDDPEFSLGLRSYVGEYLKEEILAEGLTRSLPVFSRFLEIAAIGDTENLNFSNIARECAISSKTAQSYFEILQDTLLGEFLSPFAKRPKRRASKSPKFYFHDVGIVNFLSSRKDLLPRSSEFGKAFENWIFHELSCFRKYSRSDYPLTFWQLSTGVEVDFILGDMKVAIEAKSSASINDNHLKGLRELKKDFPEIKERLIVCMEEHLRATADGIVIMPYRIFLERLWALPLTPEVEPSFL